MIAHLGEPGIDRDVDDDRGGQDEGDDGDAHAVDPRLRSGSLTIGE